MIRARRPDDAAAGARSGPADVAVLRDHAGAIGCRLLLRRAAARVLAALARSCDSLRVLGARVLGPRSNNRVRPVRARSSTRSCARRRERTRPRVTLLASVRRRPSRPTPTSISDSTRRPTISDLRLRRSPTRRRRAQGGQRHERRRRRRARAGRAAAVLAASAVRRVVVFSAPLADVADNVALIRRQILVAGVIALIARAHRRARSSRAAISRRVRRLEQGAPARRRAATSRARFPVDSDDELGQLAAALDEMQRQLAQLDYARKRVHRERVARAAHADLLARRLPRAAPGRGPRRATPAREFIRRCASRSTACRSSRPTCSTSPGWTRARSSCAGADRRSARSRDAIDRRVRAARSARDDSTIELRLAARAIEAICDPSASPRSCASCVDNALTPHAAGHRPSSRRARAAAERRRCGSRSRDDGPGIKRRDLAHVFEPLPHRRRRAAAPASASRSPASSPSGCRAVSTCDSRPAAAPTFALAAAGVERRRGERGRSSAPRRWRRSPRVLRSGGVRRTTRRARRRRVGTTVERTSVQVVEGLGEGGFDPRRDLRRDSRRASVTIISASSAAAARLLGGGGSAGQGRGFVIDGDGQIATNAHVVTNGTGDEHRRRRRRSTSSSPTATRSTRRSSASTRTPTSGC